MREFSSGPPDFALLLALRLAALFHRSRSDIQLPHLEVRLNGKEFELRIGRKWLESNPMTDTLLAAEIEQWAALGLEFSIKRLEESKAHIAGKAARSATGT
jgi:exopolyphosphatase/guanosine-5'-triphosphate,3'-diphosphate pyrophosphatase